MTNNKRNFLYVVGANSFNLILGILNSFLIPALLTLDGNGYYRLYLYYISYLGFFHLGFNDGIYLRYGASNYNDMDRQEFRTYFKFLVLEQLFFTILLLCLSFIFLREERLFVVIFTLINMTFVNGIYYFSYISQITQKFKIYSLQTILSKLLLLIPVVFLMIYNIHNYKLVIYIDFSVNIVVFLMFLVYFRKIVFGKSYSIFTKLHSILLNISIGFPLMIGNFIGLLILNIDRFFIDTFFEISDFSIYSFALNMLSLVLIFVSSISVLLYPMLSRIEATKYKTFYYTLSRFSVYLFSFGLLAYFVLNVIITQFLDKYTSSLVIFAILLPCVILRAVMNIVINNFFKLLKRQKAFFINNLIAFLISALFNMLFYWIYKTPESIAIASLISFIFWYIYSDLYFSKYFHYFDYKNYIYLALIIGSYFLFLNISSIVAGATMFLLTYIVLTFIIYRSQIYQLFTHKGFDYET